MEDRRETYGGSSVGAGGAMRGAVPSPPDRPPIAVLVVDDVALVRERVAQLVSADLRLRLAGTACDGVEAIEMIEAHRPDLVVLDVFMPNMDGAEVLAWIRRSRPAAKVLVLTGGPDPRLHDALILRPDSLLYKDAVAEEGQICEEIVGLMAGEDTLGNQLLRAAAPLAERRPSLTPSELAVLVCAAEDQSAKEIAAKLGRKVKQVQNQLQAIHRKLEVGTTTGAVAKAYEAGLLRSPRGIPPLSPDRSDETK